MDPRSVLTLDPEAYISVTRFRLSAGFTLEPIICRICNKRFDINGTHALCCAPGEDKEIRDFIFDVTMQADATAEGKVLGLLIPHFSARCRRMALHINPTFGFVGAVHGGHC